LNGSVSGITYNSSIYYKIVLSDGSVMWFRTGGDDKTGKCSYSDSNLSNQCARFWYDVNGDKKPNAAGRDIFIYDINTDGVYPHTDSDCRKNSSGWGCTAYIIQHSNMNYLH